MINHIRVLLIIPLLVLLSKTLPKSATFSDYFITKSQQRLHLNLLSFVVINLNSELRPTSNYNNRSLRSKTKLTRNIAGSSFAEQYCLMISMKKFFSLHEAQFFNEMKLLQIPIDIITNITGNQGTTKIMIMQSRKTNRKYNYQNWKKLISASLP